MCKAVREINKYTDWNGYLSQFLQVGDLVTQAMVDYFINVLPPATLTGSLIQIGEPHDMVNGKATYPTLKKTHEGWVYAGNCYIRKSINIVSVFEQLQLIRNTNAPAQVNGQEAWVISAPWGPGIRYYPNGTGFIGMREKTRDGVILLMEKL